MNKAYIIKQLEVADRINERDTRQSKYQLMRQVNEHPKVKAAQKANNAADAAYNKIKKAVEKQLEAPHDTARAKFKMRYRDVMDALQYAITEPELLAARKKALAFLASVKRK